MTSTAAPTTVALAVALAVAAPTIVALAVAATTATAAPTTVALAVAACYLLLFQLHFIVVVVAVVVVAVVVVAGGGGAVVGVALQVTALVMPELRSSCWSFCCKTIVAVAHVTVAAVDAND